MTKDKTVPDDEINPAIETLYEITKLRDGDFSATQTSDIESLPAGVLSALDFWLAQRNMDTGNVDDIRVASWSGGKLKLYAFTFLQRKDDEAPASFHGTLVIKSHDDSRFEVIGASARSGLRRHPRVEG
ncbi:MAG: hypothetical protein JWM87_2510 [Candidatus Eremiobacteraeota bacterium]|nr:hypothetical protein [Candidatus Eremiobacteraeota bacterium]